MMWMSASRMMRWGIRRICRIVCIIRVVIVWNIVIRVVVIRTPPPVVVPVIIRRVVIVRISVSKTYRYSVRITDTYINAGVPSAIVFIFVVIIIVVIIL